MKTKDFDALKYDDKNIPSINRTEASNMHNKMELLLEGLRDGFATPHLDNLLVSQPRL